MEQRYQAVLEVQAGVPVVDVAQRFGVSRQAVHRWIGWYRDEGLDGLADRSHRPQAHPAQTSPERSAWTSAAWCCRMGGRLRSPAHPSRWTRRA